MPDQHTADADGVSLGTRDPGIRAMYSKDAHLRNRIAIGRRTTHIFIYYRSFVVVRGTPPLVARGGL
eukprot:7381045-Prymnesium_polylepis.2